MALSFGSATLTASFAQIGNALALPGSWAENRSDGRITIRLKHTKHASQSGGYPVVRVRFKVPNATGTEIAVCDWILDTSITVSNGIASVTAATPEFAIQALKDSDGTVEYPLVVRVPPYHTKVLVQAKQAGDTTNFGTLAVELDGRI